MYTGPKIAPVLKVLGNTGLEHCKTNVISHVCYHLVDRYVESYVMLYVVSG